jgi:hypothetical protein
MENTAELVGAVTAAPKPKRALAILRWVGRGTLFLVGAVVLAALVWQTVWYYSGSGQWEALPARNGVHVYSLKSPGTTLLKFKGSYEAHASLGALAKFMMDPAVCDDVGCRNARILQQTDPLVQYQTFIYDYPSPFAPRQFVVKQVLSQDPATQAVTVQIDAVPDRLAADPCCVRIRQMHNSWRFIPLGGGRAQVEYSIDMDEGGFIPAFLQNQIHPDIIYSLPDVQKIVDKPKYKDTRLDFIGEKP